MSNVQWEMIEASGRVSQLLGLPRSLGQIYGLLYFSLRPLCLDEIAGILRISKASSSMGTRQLCSWNAIRQVWIHGERKDHFEADPEVANLLRVAYSKFIKPRVGSAEGRLGRLSDALDQDLKSGGISEDEFALLAGRLKTFSSLQKKVKTLLPLVEKFI